MISRRLVLSLFAIGLFSVLSPATLHAADGTVVTQNNLKGPLAGQVFLTYVNRDDPAKFYTFDVKANDSKTVPMASEIGGQRYIVVAYDPGSEKSKSTEITVLPNRKMHVFIHNEGRALCISVVDDYAIKAIEAIRSSGVE